MPKQFSEVEQFATFPVFLLVDVSPSMSRELPTLNTALREIRTVLKEEPDVCEKARLAVITFAQRATRVLPLSDIQYMEMPEVKIEGQQTNFAEAFRIVRLEIESAIRELGPKAPFHTPVLYFWTDGEHNVPQDPWAGPLRELTSASNKYRPEIVAFGFRDADPDDLQRIATTHAFLARSGRPPAEQLKEIIAAVIGSIKFTSGSLRAADAGQAPAGGLGVPIDSTKFIALPVRSN
ncbi:hypothetical protein Acor_13920 [Acrocarpospora corrugata]|uniref:VWFA domain-containing protein n=1 Tax=Acrocarpospora corrugata TaxID=35763 RepID=A0A5M3VSY3_9ACTN|nr:VWA domain-containing protein [Acrocarpospora corrugata]GER99328.1 hypothetical protein Acor_13920 [Acrocarpospora corrugata]